MASTTERFWSKVDVPAEPGCWEWLAAKNPVSGYGAFGVGHREIVGAHRFAYQSVNGPIEKGMQIDHLCRNRSCVNPAHLEAVTPAENTRRGEAGKKTAEARKALTHCKRGHEFTEENTYRPDGNRHCKTCQRERARAWWANKRIIGAK